MNIQNIAKKKKTYKKPKEKYSSMDSTCSDNKQNEEDGSLLV